MATLPPLLRDAALSLATLPTATFCEHHVRAEVQRQLRGTPFVRLQRDRFGNLLARYRRTKGRAIAAPLGLVAHLDHPGFGIGRRRGQRTLHLLGGVREANLPGHRVEFFANAHPEALGTATVTATRWTRQKKWVELDAAIPRAAAFAMWKLPPGGFRGKRFVGRVCDDLAQVATLVALLRELSRAKVNADLWCLFTRAEEVGFLGALASEDGGLLPPKRVPILSLECSQARGFAQMGAGPILRVGDRSTVFTPSVTAWMDETAAAARIQHQRLLMAGGSCEATAFASMGRPVGGICLALHNYHNMTARGGIGAEAVDVGDWADQFKLLFELVSRRPPESSLAPRLAKLKQAALTSLPPGA